MKILPILACALLLLPACAMSPEQRVHRDMIAVLSETDLNQFNECDMIGTPPITVEEQVQGIPIETQQLMIACARGDIAKLQELLDAGHQPTESYPVLHNIPFTKHPTAPRSAFEFALYANQVECVSYLQKRYPELKWEQRHLWVVCRFGHLEMAQYMLKQRPDFAGEQALDDAVKSGNIKLVQVLLSKGVKSQAALRIACERSSIDMVDTLLQAGFNPNQSDTVPPINEIFWNGDDRALALLKLLLKHGASAESLHPDAEAVLSCACRMNDEQKCIAMMKQLIAHGAQVNKQDASGETLRPLDAAIDREQHQVTAYLISQGASCQQLTAQGKSTLKDAEFWTKGYGLKPQECLIIQGIYSDEGCLIVHQSPTQQFELRIPKLADIPAYLPAQVKHILILDKLTDAKREELQAFLTQQNKAHVSIYAATNYLPSNSPWPTP